MTQVPIFPIKTSNFHFHATPVTVEVGDTPALGMAVPLNGKTDVRLEVTPILLVSGDAKPRLINVKTVTHELQQRGQVASFIAYEVSCDSLPAGSERCLEWFYCKVEPCYLLPQKHEKTRKRRLAAIRTLMGDLLLQQFIKEEVLPGADPLMPSALRQLFNNRLSKSTFENDLKEIRQEKAHQATPAPEPSPPSAAPPNYPVQPDDDTHLSHDGASASLDSILCAIGRTHCTRRYASHGKRQEIEHAKKKSSHAFGASRLHRRIGRNTDTLLWDSLGINTREH